MNAIRNAVSLKHKPTGITVKIHESRLLPENIDIAFERMKFAVDRHLNGEACYEAQFKRIQDEVEEKRNQQRRKKRLIKAELMKNNTDDAESQ